VGWSSLAAFATEKETYSDERFHTKTMAALPDATLDITNKYGDVVVNTWEKDSIKIEISLKATARKEDVLADLMNNTAFNIGGTPGYMYAETVLHSSSGIVKKGFQEVNLSVLGGRELEVNYTVYVPAKTRLNIDNKFGNVTLGVFEGELRLDLAHGDLRAIELNEVRKMDVKYSKITIKKVDNAVMNLEFAKLYLDEARQLEIESRGGEIEIQKVDQIRIQSKGDQVLIEEVIQLTGKHRLSDFTIQKLKGLLDLQTNFGSVSIRELDVAFTNLNLTSEMTRIEVNFTSAIQFNFNVSIHNKGEFVYSGTGAKVDGASTIDKTTTWKGKVGQQPKAKVNIENKNASVTFGRGF